MTIPQVLTQTIPGPVWLIGSTLLVIITALLALFIAWLVYRNKPHSATNLLFVFWTLIVLPWMMSNQLALFFPHDPQVTLFFIRITMFCATLQTVSFFLFAHTFPGDHIHLNKRYLIPLLFVVSTVAILTQTPYIFHHVVIVGKSITAVPGSLMWLFAALAIGLISAGFYQLIKKYRIAQSATQNSFRLILIGAIVMFGFVIIFNFLVVVIFNITFFVSFEPVFVMPYMILTFFAITRYRLFDITVLFRKRWLQTGAILLGSVIELITLFFLVHTVSSNTLLSWLFGGALLFAANVFIVHLVNKYLHRSVYDFSLPEPLQFNTSLEQALHTLNTEVGALLRQQFNIYDHWLMVFDHNSKHYKSLNTEKLIYLNHADPVISYVQQHRQLMTVDAAAAEVRHFLRKHRAAAIIPLATTLDVYGLVVIPQRAWVKSQGAKEPTNPIFVQKTHYFGALLEKMLMYQALLNQGQQYAK